MTENRKRILEMLATGKITVDEAARLLSALGEEREAPAPKSHTGGKARYLRVVVNHPQGYQSEGPERVNIRVPIALIRAGMKFTSLIPKEASDEVDKALAEKGIKLNLKNIKEEDLDELIEALSDLEVEIDNGKGKVQVESEY
jgi:hypothetical protein